MRARCCGARDTNSRAGSSVTGRYGMHWPSAVASVHRQDTVELCGALPQERVIQEYERGKMCSSSLVSRRATETSTAYRTCYSRRWRCGFPVIAGDLPAIRELVVDGVSGSLVGPGDDEALSYAPSPRICSIPTCSPRSRGNRARERRAVDGSTCGERSATRLAGVLWPACTRRCGRGVGLLHEVPASPDG